MKSRAFTLIELLVVVLIIGILSAIALPQYQVAVTRARYQELVLLGDSIATAQQVYYMMNNEYATDAEALDVQIPSSQRKCNLSSTFTQCWLNNNLVYEIDYQRKYRSCMAKIDNSLYNQICRNETGKGTPTKNVYGLNYYVYP